MTTQVLALDRDRPYGLYAISFGFFLVVLDTTVLNVAVAPIQREFGGTLAGLQWVVNAYTIVFASLVLTGGALADRFGARRLYQLGLALFTLMSLACALAPTVAVLIAMRMLQGLGAACMLPASLALLSHAHPAPGERARAVSFWASVVSIGFAAGPAVGGVLIGAFGWRSVFIINVPIGVATLVMIRAFITETPIVRSRRIDWAGQTSVSLALWALTYGLIEAGDAGWSARRVIAAFAAAVVLALTFAISERRSSAPVLPRILLSRPALVACVAIGVVLNFGMYGMLFIESIYLQSERHLTPLATGVMILPFTVLPAVTTRLLDRYRGDMHFRQRLLAGHVAAVVGAALLGLSIVFPGVILTAIGLGFLGVAIGYIMPAMTSGVLTESPAETSGVASGLLNAGRQVGGSIGVALMGTLVQMHHDQGMLLSFAVMLVSFALMAGIAARAIPTQAAAAA